jgi:hypothetical protein
MAIRHQNAQELKFGRAGFGVGDVSAHCLDRVSNEQLGLTALLGISSQLDA